MDEKGSHINKDTIAKYLSGEADVTEIGELMDWIESSDENLEEFIRFEKLWSASTVHKSVDTNKAWEKVNNHILSKKHRLKSHFYTVFVAAAAIALIIVVVQFFNSKKTITPPLFAVTSTDNALNSTLPDGSAVLLSERSKIEYAFDVQKHIRLAKLSGKAFFSVKRDEKQRFVVETNCGGVEVLGTKFSVNVMKNNNVMVDVLSGKVKVFLPRASKDTLSMIITDGETALILVKNDTIIKQTQEASAFYTINKTITFRNMELSAIFIELEKCYAVNIRIDNTVDKKFRFSSSFKNNSLNEILTVITQTLNLDYTKKGNTYYIINGNDE